MRECERVLHQWGLIHARIDEKLTEGSLTNGQVKELERLIRDGWEVVCRRAE